MNGYASDRFTDKVNNIHVFVAGLPDLVNHCTGRPLLGNMRSLFVLAITSLMAMP
jgi:hypothetical protein